MKNFLVFIILLSLQPFGFSQGLTNLDEVSQINENLVAIKKGTQWGFINKDGLLVIDFRNDLVVEDDEFNSPPYFNYGRCLIKKLINNEYLYGYIDTYGNEIIKPQYLNASNFSNGYAIIIIIKLLKETVGYNEVLKKDITTSKYEEFIIDIDGGIVKYLENPRNYIPSKVKPEKPPVFHSKFVAPHLIAVMKKDKKWDIYKF
tara:strand:+ start:39204 stop:39812 length:609 start_codon:yes stop_codon:yes gene_type:complete